MEANANMPPQEAIYRLHSYPVVYFQLGEMTSFLHSYLSVLLTSDMMKLVIVIDYSSPKVSWRNKNAAGFLQKLLPKWYGSPFVNRRDPKPPSNKESDQGPSPRDRPPAGPSSVLPRTNSKGPTHRRKLARGTSLGQRHPSPSRPPTKRNGRRRQLNGADEAQQSRSRPLAFLSYPVRIKWHRLEMLLRRHARTGSSGSGARDLMRLGFHGCVTFEVLWDDVRGINYTNELLAETSLSLEASTIVKRDFGDIREAYAWYVGGAGGTPFPPETSPIAPLGRQRSFSERGDRGCGGANQKTPFDPSAGMPHQRGRHRRGWGGALRLSHGGTDAEESQGLLFHEGINYPYAGVSPRSIGWEAEWELGGGEKATTSSAASLGRSTSSQSDRSLGRDSSWTRTERRWVETEGTNEREKGGGADGPGPPPFPPPRHSMASGIGSTLVRRPSRSRRERDAARPASSTAAAREASGGADGSSIVERRASGRDLAVTSARRDGLPAGSTSSSSVVQPSCFMPFQHLTGLLRCMVEGTPQANSLGAFLRPISPLSGAEEGPASPSSPLSPLGVEEAAPHQTAKAIAQLPPQSPDRGEILSSGEAGEPSRALHRTESSGAAMLESGAEALSRSAPAILGRAPDPEIPSSSAGRASSLPAQVSVLPHRPRSSSLPSEVESRLQQQQHLDEGSTAIVADVARGCHVSAPEEVFKDVLIVLRFTDPLLPLELRAIFTSDQKLLSMFESGIPPWAIFLQSFPVTRRLYRSWMRPLASLIIFVVSLVTLVVGFYDLYKHVPILKEAVHSLMGPFFEWIEDWEMGSRLYYIASILFLQNLHKAFKWTVSVVRGLRIVLDAILEPLHGPLLTLSVLLAPLGQGLASAARLGLPLWHLLLAIGEALLPLWEAVIEIGLDFAEVFHACTAAIQSGLLIVGSASWQLATALWSMLASLISLFRALFDLVLWPIAAAMASLLSLVVRAAGVLYKVLESLWKVLATPANQLLGLLQMFWAGLCQLAGSVASLSKTTGAAVQTTWATQAPVTRTVRASRDVRAASSVWLTVLDDLITKLSRGFRFFFSGLLALLGSFNRHRLSLYNYVTRRKSLPGRGSHGAVTGSGKGSSPVKIPTDYTDRLYQQLSPHAQLVYRGRHGRELWSEPGGLSVDDGASDAMSDASVDDGSIMDGYRSEGGSSIHAGLDPREAGYKDD